MGSLGHLTKLTDWETGRPVYVKLADVTWLERLSAHVYESCGSKKGEFQELGERTKLVVGTEIHLVRETPDEIFLLTETD